MRTPNRLDNERVMEFFTTLFLCLKETNAYPPSVIDPFLYRVQSYLHPQKDELRFYEFAETDEGLSFFLHDVLEGGALRANLGRFTMRPALRRLGECIRSTQNALKQKAQQYFNRQIFIFGSSELEREEYAGRFFADLGQGFADVLLGIERAEAASQVFARGILGLRGEAFEGALASALSFAKVDDSSFSELSDMKIRGGLSEALHALLMIHDIAQKRLFGWEPNPTLAPFKKMRSDLSELMLKLQNYAHLYESLGPEKERQELLTLTERFLDLTEGWLAVFMGVFTPLLETRVTAFGSAQTWRGISSELLASGVSPLGAKRAAHDWLSYCKKHRIEPKEVIREERVKISSELSALVNIPAYDVIKDKDRTLMRLATLGMICLLVVSLVACGHKTAAKSSKQWTRSFPPFHGIVSKDKNKNEQGK